MSEQRLKGQEVSIRVINSGVVVAAIDTVSSFNEEVDIELKSAGYLGEFVNRFDEIFNGFGGDMEINVTKASWNELQQSVIARAQRKQPDLVFNVIRTDFFPNGDSTIYTYHDVNWGPMPSSVASRGDYVKPKLSFKCSERPVQNNALP